MTVYEPRLTFLGKGQFSGSQIHEDGHLAAKVSTVVIVRAQCLQAPVTREPLDGTGVAVRQVQGICDGAMTQPVWACSQAHGPP